MKINYKKLKNLNRENAKRRYKIFIIETINLLKESIKTIFNGLIVVLLLPFVVLFLLIKFILLSLKVFFAPTFYNIRLKIRLILKKKKLIAFLEKNKNKVDWIEE